MNTRELARPIMLVMGWSPGSPGGVTTVVTNLFTELMAKCREAPALLVDSWADTTLRTADSAGFPSLFRRIPTPGVDRMTLKSLGAFVIAALFQSSDILQLLRKRRFSTVNLHYPGLESLFWIACRTIARVDFRILLSFHGADVTTMRRQMATPVGRASWGIIFRNVQGATTCSDALAQELRELQPRYAGKISVLENGIHPPSIIAEASRGSVEPLFEPGRYFIFIGGFERKKGLDLLLRAYAMARHRGLKEGLLVISRDGPERQDLEVLARDLGVDTAAKFLVDCPHEQAMQHLSHAAALITPSRREPFGLVVLEAAVLGIPVILTEVCGVLASIRNQTALTVLGAEDPSAITESLLQAASGSGPTTEQLRELKNEVVSNLTWSRATEKLLSQC